MIIVQLVDRVDAGFVVFGDAECVPGSQQKVGGVCLYIIVYPCTYKDGL